MDVVRSSTSETGTSEEESVDEEILLGSPSQRLRLERPLLARPRPLPWQWALNELNKLWNNTRGCKQAKWLVSQVRTSTI